MKKRRSRKKPKEIPFYTLVDEVAGDALMRLIRGENWRAIIWYVCVVATQWANKEKRDGEAKKIKA